MDASKIAYILSYAGKLIKDARAWSGILTEKT